MLENDFEILTTQEQEYIQSGAWTEDYPRLNETLTTPKFKISELGISARDASYWDKQGVLPDLIGRGAMRKYNLVQAIWIRLIPQMRAMSISLPMIKKLKEKIMLSTFNLKDYINTDHGRQYLREIAKLKGEEKEFEELMNSGKLDNIETTESLDAFYFLVMNTIIFRKNLNIMVFEDGTYVPYSIDKLELLYTAEGIEDVLRLPHFTLSIEQAYNDVLKDWSKKPFFKDLSIISEDELEVLEALKLPNLKSVLVKYSGGQIDLIEIAQEQSIELGTRFMDIISKHGFHTVTLKTRNGKPVHFENKVIKKIKRTG